MHAKPVHLYRVQIIQNWNCI